MGAQRQQYYGAMAQVMTGMPPQQTGAGAANGANSNQMMQMGYMQDGQAGQYMIGQGGQMAGGDNGMPGMVGGMGGDTSGQAAGIKGMGAGGAKASAVTTTTGSSRTRTVRRTTGRVKEAPEQERRRGARLQVQLLPQDLLELPSALHPHQAEAFKGARRRSARASHQWSRSRKTSQESVPSDGPSEGGLLQQDDKKGGPTDPLLWFHDHYETILKETYSSIEEYPLYKYLKQFSPSRTGSAEGDKIGNPEQAEGGDQEAKAKKTESADEPAKEENKDDANEGGAASEAKARSDGIEQRDWQEQGWARNYLRLSEQEKLNMFVDEIFALYLFTVS
eukprot:CAMPEP_0185570108 /NCGR_PEP_ID=MMETSP0434-20130131/2527_1 /TAXON_ID=626734 ORGANISM="Favella taraikaensis, Strain Fe Narragansett Bay" /NCGR_SAMPLE_ID=MMETSP0434 /ASSEMBLY_ACC=CAM_ASM_000379 /LENGTH=334 /DNA_ID=CAMNT_0028185123 /DNA_START=53 /DNA_END=1060 /DNA_ORIENTATION=+